MNFGDTNEVTVLLTFVGRFPSLYCLSQKSERFVSLGQSPERQGLDHRLSSSSGLLRNTVCFECLLCFFYVGSLIFEYFMG